nr:hypothetical protein [bacterium]
MFQPVEKAHSTPSYLKREQQIATDHLRLISELMTEGKIALATTTIQGFVNRMSDSIEASMAFAAQELELNPSYHEFIFYVVRVALLGKVEMLMSEV